MWDFIWHLRGSTRIDGKGSNEAVLGRVERLLEQQRKPVTWRGADYLVFESPMWSDLFGPNWLAMVVYDRGRFWIEQGMGGRILRYDLRSLHGFIFCLFAAFIVFFVGLAGGVGQGLKFAAIAFGWLYGMNMLLAWARAPRAIRKAVAQPWSE